MHYPSKPLADQDSKPRLLVKASSMTSPSALTDGRPTSWDMSIRYPYRQASRIIDILRNKELTFVTIQFQVLDCLLFNQSAFHLSFAVLLHYQSLAYI